MPHIRLEAPHEQPGYVVTGFQRADEQTAQVEGTAAEIPQDHTAIAVYHKQFRTAPRPRDDRAREPGR